MIKFIPFANEADAIDIGELSIENHQDRLEIYGSLRISRDQAGLKLAQELKRLLDATVTALKAAPLPEQISFDEPDETDNPFK